MKHIQTPSHTFIAVRLDTTGSVLRKPFDVVKKFNIVVTPAKRYMICERFQYELDASMWMMGGDWMGVMSGKLLLIPLFFVTIWYRKSLFEAEFVYMCEWMVFYCWISISFYTQQFLYLNTERAILDVYKIVQIKLKICDTTDMHDLRAYKSF